MKYIKIWFYFLKEIFFYSYMLILNNVHLLFLIFVLTSLTLFGANAKWIDNIWGISLWLYAWYVFITELVMINRKDQNMIDEIKWWSIVTYLNKPINFVWFYFSQWFFKNLINILIVWLFCGIFLFIFVGRFPWFGFDKIFLFIISLLVWVWLLSLVSLMIALFAFVLEDSTFIRMFINKLYFIFWWLFFPLDIYPKWMQNIAEFFPFKYYLYAPAKFFATGDIWFFKSYFPLQIMWLAIMSLLVIFIYSRVVRKLEINGW